MEAGVGTNEFRLAFKLNAALRQRVLQVSERGKVLVLKGRVGQGPQVLGGLQLW